MLLLIRNIQNIGKRHAKNRGIIVFANLWLSVSLDIEISARKKADNERYEN
jgi:hypothetical protein